MGVTMTFESEHNRLQTLLSPFHRVKKVYQNYEILLLLQPKLYIYCTF
jgi:hypothetical protein